jgi:DNA-binding NtrC family response regulator
MTRDQRTILLVEDDIVIRSPLAEYLRECGYHVLEANSAAEARRHLADTGRSIDVVMADMEVDGGGFALSAWIRQTYPGVAVLLAGSVEKATEKAGDLCEDGPPISKPYDHQLILDRIRRMMAARERNSK